MSRPTSDFTLTRRAFLARHAGCLGPLALAHLLAPLTLPSPPSDGGEDRVRGDGQAAPARSRSPLATKTPHHRPTARAVICLFQHGGPSQMDLFDPKPELTRRHGQKHPGQLEVHFHTQTGNLLASPFRFRKHGRSGMELSELLPHTAGVVDELTLVRSMKTESVDHEAALRMIHSGKTFQGRPVWGSWVVYGLGSERQELPAYVVLSDPGGLPVDGTGNWSSGFLPAVYQGTPFRAAGAPVAHLRPPAQLPDGARRNQLQFLGELNSAHLKRHPGESELEARLASYELAARMQTAVPEVLDIRRETAETQRLYGLDDARTAEYGRRCLLARRLVERGVRFVQVFLSGQPWDTHDKNAERLRGLCARTDRPAAALVADLKRRGLLETTLVMWTGEFGRLPVSQGKNGRDHNRHGFSLWLAGGGFKRGYVHGATDEFGYKAVQDVVTVPDLHATLLHALGLDHETLTYPHDGREDHLTDSAVSHAQVIDDLLG